MDDIIIKEENGIKLKICDLVNTEEEIFSDWDYSKRDPHFEDREGCFKWVILNKKTTQFIKAGRPFLKLGNCICDLFENHYLFFLEIVKNGWPECQKE